MQSLEFPFLLILINELYGGKKPLFFAALPMKLGHFISGEAFTLEFIFAAAVATGILWILGGVEHCIETSSTAQARILKPLSVLLIPLSWLGQSSYSLYLLHGQLMKLPETFIRQIIQPQSLVFALLTLITTAALCFCFYKVVELPCQNFGKFFIKRTS